jgi:hypothetical protein
MRIAARARLRMFTMPIIMETVKPTSAANNRMFIMRLVYSLAAALSSGKIAQQCSRCKRTSALAPGGERPEITAVSLKIFG